MSTGWRGSGRLLDRRQLLQAGAAAALAAAISPQRAVASVHALWTGGVFCFDPRHAPAQRLAAGVQAHGATVIAVDPDAAVRVLPAGTQVLAGRTTYADFTWLSDLGRAHGMRLRFHAYQTFGAGRPDGSAARRVLVQDPARSTGLARESFAVADGRVDGGRWAQAPAAARAGCTLHDWLFQAV